MQSKVLKSTTLKLGYGCSVRAICRFSSERLVRFRLRAYIRRYEYYIALLWLHVSNKTKNKETLSKLTCVLNPTTGTKPNNYYYYHQTRGPNCNSFPVHTLPSNRPWCCTRICEQRRMSGTYDVVKERCFGF